MAIINYIGKIRLVKHPQAENYLLDTDRVRIQLPPPKLQQFDGKDWVDVEIVDLEDQVTI